MNYKKQSPALYEAVFSDIQDSLSANLSWLNNTFGKAERVQRIINERRYYEPAWYKEHGDYILLSPTDTLGNFSFFTIGEPQLTEWDTWGATDLTAPFSLIVWLDLRKTKDSDRNVEAIKESILKVLNGRTHTSEGSYSITRIYERAENVYEGFTLDETTNQFTMHPYVAFRFFGQIRVHTTCDTLK